MLLRVLGAILLVDGTLDLAFGRGYARRLLIGPARSPYRRLMGWIASRPGWLLRLVGLAKAGLGVALLRKAPVGVRELYHTVAGVYDAASPIWRDRAYADAHATLELALVTHLPAGGRVLDLGCGTGANLQRLLALGLPLGSYTGVDLSGDMLARARAKGVHLPNTSFQQLDLTADPLPEGPFDLVISTWVFSHLPDPAAVVQKAWERLRPGGHVILLFLTETGSWPDRLILPLGRFFSARPLPENVYRRFPGLASLQRFGSGTVAVAILRKPDSGI